MHKHGDNAAAQRLPKQCCFLDVKSLYADTMPTKVVLNLTMHSSALSLTAIMACQCHLKIALCHHFDAGGDNQVDHLPCRLAFILQTKQSMWEKVVRGAVKLVSTLYV